MFGVLVSLVVGTVRHNANLGYHDILVPIKFRLARNASEGSPQWATRSHSNGLPPGGWVTIQCNGFNGLECVENHVMRIFTKKQILFYPGKDRALYCAACVEGIPWGVFSFHLLRGHIGAGGSWYMDMWSLIELF